MTIKGGVGTEFDVERTLKPIKQSNVRYQQQQSQLDVNFYQL